ncbi:hypothetical protein U1Q18_002291, partial [Sarracenia purpurea var. burkii]
MAMLNRYLGCRLREGRGPIKVDAGSDVIDKEENYVKRNEEDEHGGTFIELFNLRIWYDHALYSAKEKTLLKIAKILQNLAPKSPQRLLEEKFISLLQSCKSPKCLQQIQAQVTAHGFVYNEYITPRFVTAYAELKRMDYARRLFDGNPHPDIVLWNAMFKGYVRSELYVEVVLLFNHMKSVDVKPNCFTFPMVLKSCAKLPALQEGERVHCFLLKIGFRSNPFIGTTLIEMYSSGGAVGCAYNVFREMVVRNVVAWTSMINAYISSRDVVSARSLFDLAPVRDVVLWNTMVSGYIECRDMVAARRLFDEMPNKDLMSWNTLLNGYANNSDVDG